MKPYVKPYLLIDVDGVLSPFGWDKPLAGYRQIDHTYHLWLNDQHGDWIKSLMPHFDPVWATWWHHSANTYISPELGLPPFPVIEFDSIKLVRYSLKSLRTWKLPSVVDFVGDRPFAWIDDDLGEDVFAFAEERNMQGIATMPIKPRSSEGMTEEHIVTLEEFSESLWPCVAN